MRPVIPLAITFVVLAASGCLGAPLKAPPTCGYQVSDIGRMRKDRIPSVILSFVGMQFRPTE